MECEQRLQKTAALEELGWYAAAQDIITRDYDLGLVAEDCAVQLANQVAFELIKVADLRIGVLWTAGLNREVYEICGGIVRDMHAADYAEAITRRLAYRAGRRALSLTRKESQRFALRARLGGHNANAR